MNTWIELVSWNMVCHRTMATQDLPDFGLIAFANRTWEYFIDVLKVQNDQEIAWEHDDYYSRAEQLADEANADYWDEVAKTANK